MLTLFSMTFATAQDVRYYKLTRKMENGNFSTNVIGGQFITFAGKICFESNNHGVGVNHGTMERNDNYCNSQYSVYQQKTGSGCYWGKDATFKFNADKSVLNVVLDNGDIYVYKRAAAPANQETCSLIRKPSSGGNTGGAVVGGITPPPVYPVEPYNPTPTPTPQPTPTPKPTPQKTHQCGLCGGSGRVATTDGVPSFGNTKYCSECGKTVPDNHYHTTCPSCKGKGWW